MCGVVRWQHIFKSWTEWIALGLMCAYLFSQRTTALFLLPQNEFRGNLWESSDFYGFSIALQRACLDHKQHCFHFASFARLIVCGMTVFVAVIAIVVVKLLDDWHTIRLCFFLFFCAFCCLRFFVVCLCALLPKSSNISFGGPCWAHEPVAQRRT